MTILTSSLYETDQTDLPYKHAKVTMDKQINVESQFCRRTELYIY